MFPFRPQPHAYAQRGAAGATRPLIRRRCADLLNQERVDAPVRVVAGHPRQAAVDDRSHAINGQRGFRDVGRHDDLATIIAGNGPILRLRRKFAVQRQH